MMVEMEMTNLANGAPSGKSFLTSSRKRVWYRSSCVRACLRISMPFLKLAKDFITSTLIASMPRFHEAWNSLTTASSCLYSAVSRTAATPPWASGCSVCLTKRITLPNCASRTSSTNTALLASRSSSNMRRSSATAPCSRRMAAAASALLIRKTAWSLRCARSTPPYRVTSMACRADRRVLMAEMTRCSTPSAARSCKEAASSAYRRTTGRGWTSRVAGGGCAVLTREACWCSTVAKKRSQHTLSTCSKNALRPPTLRDPMTPWCRRDTRTSSRHPMVSYVVPRKSSRTEASWLSVRPWTFSKTACWGPKKSWQKACSEHAVSTSMVMVEAQTASKCTTCLVEYTMAGMMGV
mmetsp:Transcript_15207/g.51347  ORF Transcript_15207/g.51347 Transcript_15207/m.51347 type:complete len:352 (-) Transcript_15207:952-2007(-)